MPREAYWVFGSWVQPAGWVLVAVGVLVSVAAAALIVHRYRRGVPVAMRRRGDESPARPGPALTHAATAASRKVL